MILCKQNNILGETAKIQTSFKTSCEIINKERVGTRLVVFLRKQDYNDLVETRL